MIIEIKTKRLEMFHSPYLKVTFLDEIIKKCKLKSISCFAHDVFLKSLKLKPGREGSAFLKREWITAGNQWTVDYC